MHFCYWALPYLWHNAAMNWVPRPQWCILFNNQLAIHRPEVQICACTRHDVPLVSTYNKISWSADITDGQDHSEGPFTRYDCRKRLFFLAYTILAWGHNSSYDSLANVAKHPDYCGESITSVRRNNCMWQLYRVNRPKVPTPKNVCQLTVILFIEIADMADMCPRNCRTYVSLFKSQIMQVMS